MMAPDSLEIYDLKRFVKSSIKNVLEAMDILYLSSLQALDISIFFSTQGRGRAVMQKLSEMLSFETFWPRRPLRGSEMKIQHCTLFVLYYCGQYCAYFI